jgi:hypothetical protein
MLCLHVTSSPPSWISRWRYIVLVSWFLLLHHPAWPRPLLLIYSLRNGCKAKIQNNCRLDSLISLKNTKYIMVMKGQKQTVPYWRWNALLRLKPAWPGEGTSIQCEIVTPISKFSPQISNPRLRISCLNEFVVHFPTVDSDNQTHFD